MTPLVFVEEEPTAGERREIRADATLGRENCDIVLREPTVSRRHAAIRMVDERRPTIEDLGSSAGTYVNDERVMGSRPLMTGDRVRFGNVLWRVESGAPPPPMADATVVPGGVDATVVPSTVAPSPADDPVAAAMPTGAGARGDVPRPSRVMSAIRPAIPEVSPQQPFQPVSRRRIRGSAARRVGWTAICYGTVTGTAIALAIFFAER